MRFMILVKATKDSEAGVRPPEELFAAMADYHEQLVKAGVLLDAQWAAAELEGLAHQIFRRQAHRDRRALHRGKGARRRLHDDSGEVASRRRSNGRGAFPIPPRRRDCEIEVRQLFELEDFGESETIDRFREMGLATQE